MNAAETRITPFLWFDDQAEEAARHYVSVFGKAGIGDSEILNVARYGDAGPRPAGTVLTVEMRLGGQRIVALNGGPEFEFTPAISLYVSCEDQDEVDALWEGLSEGGTKEPCGWLRDRYGVSWQIVPRILPELMTDPDPERARRATEAMLKMGKLDIAELERAAAG